MSDNVARKTIKPNVCLWRNKGHRQRIEEGDKSHEEEQEHLAGSKREDSPSQLIDARIKELGDWRGETLARVRALIKHADPEVVEACKWRGVPLWEHCATICTGETYKAVVKMTFAKGA
jgi:hypothetical protein